MRSRPPAPLVVALLVMSLLVPGLAAADPQPAGHEGGDAQATGINPSVGPQVPGAEHLAPLDLQEPSRDIRLVADAEGHLLVQGRALGDDAPERLVAVDPADGSVAWTVDHIVQHCTPVTTDDGRIFAQAVANSPLAGEGNFSADLVEIDAATGDVVAQHTPADTDADPRLGECFDSLRLGADDVVLLYQTAHFSDALVAFTTDGGLDVAWRFDPPDRTGGQRNARPVVSPDGQTAYVTHALTEDDPVTLAITALDVATGDVIATRELPGTAFGSASTFIHAGDAVLVSTGATGGADDPLRLFSLDPATLDTDWVVEEAADGEPGFTRISSLSLAGDHVVVYDDGRLHAHHLSDGSPAWTYRASSFSNNGAQVVTDARGNLYLSTFGGAALESVTPDGRRRFVTGETDELLGSGIVGEAATLGPILDDRLYTIFREADAPRRPVLVAIGSGTERLEGVGGDPISVAIQICQHLFADGEARTVVLSRDDVFADTLAGAPLAGDHSCILFTDGGPDQPLDPATLVEIQRALPPGATVRIAGGVDAVSQQAEDALAAAGFGVERLAGIGRLQTAVEIARVVAAENPSRGEAVLAYAGNWPDAVTAGAAAAERGIPVLLTGTGSLDRPTADALAELGITRTYVAGGTAVVSEAAAQAAPGPVRIAGDNRFGTAAAVAERLWGDLAADQAVVLANLEVDIGWALALAASPISVRLDAPQLGVRAADLPAETAAFLIGAGFTDPGVFALGDVTVIDEQVVAQVTASR